MAEITLKGNPIHTHGDLPGKGNVASSFKLVKSDLSEASLADYKGKRVVLNVFPSLDTGTCAMSVRQFNERASGLENTVVLCISKDLPFAHERFCSAEGIDNVTTLSAFRDQDFGKDFGMELFDGPLKGLLARSVIVLNEEGEVIYTQLVSETVDEPDYDSAIAALN